MTTYTADELRTMLRNAEAAESADFNRRLASVKPITKVTVAPHSGNFDKIYDPAVVKYKVSGVVVNKAEMEAVGHSRFHEGGLTYLYNTATKSIIMSTGGGSLFFGRPEEHMKALGEFITAHPEGGDVTDLVADMKARFPSKW